MSPFESALSVAVQLPLPERERLAVALGLKLAPKATLPLSLATAPPDRSKTDPQGWRQAERGHAVLDTGAEGTPFSDGGPIEPGPGAIRGLWAHLDLSADPQSDDAVNPNTVSALPAGLPVLVHTSVVLALALDLPSVRGFWEKPPVEVRLATATYLKLLEGCENQSQVEQVKAFVTPFAVLSLGPMASSKAAQLMLEGGAQNGLTALDALIAATALAHEIPLVTRTPRPFEGIAGLQVATLP